MSKMLKNFSVITLALLMGLFFIITVEGTAKNLAGEKEIIFVSRDDYFDASTGDLADQAFMDDLEDLGYYVIQYTNDALGSAPQDDIDLLNSVDLIILSRSAASAWFQDPNKDAWNGLTTPVLNLNLWNERNTRMNWFNTGSVGRNSTADAGDTLFAVIEAPDDPVFEGVTLADSLPWAYSPYDYITLKQAGNGTVIARSIADSAVLFVRFEPGVEYYDGAGDMPAGPRTVIGNGNDGNQDTEGNNIINFFNWSDESHQVYVNEIARMAGGETAVNDARLNNPETCRLSQNYPNPFNPTTMIAYSINENVHVTINVYNIAGQNIITLVNETHQPGDYSIQWDGKNQIGVSVTNGVYFYKMQAGDNTHIRKMIMVK